MITIKERNKNIRVFYTTTSGCFKIEHGDVIIQNMGMLLSKTWGCFATSLFM